MRFRRNGRVYAAAFEPLMAFEDDAHDVAVVGCGDHGCAPDATVVSPSHLRLERVAREASGEFVVQGTHDLPFSSKMMKACANGACLPWMRVARDPESFRRAYTRAQQLGPMQSSQQIWALLHDDMVSQDQEVFRVVLLDTQLRVRGVGEIARGARDRVETPIPDVLRLPIINGATMFVVAHNHPSGKSNPSPADRELTKTIEDAGDLMGIPLLDHVVFGAKNYYSFRDHGKLRKAR